MLKCKLFKKSISFNDFVKDLKDLSFYPTKMKNIYSKKEGGFRFLFRRKEVDKSKRFKFIENDSVKTNL